MASSLAQLLAQGSVDPALASQLQNVELGNSMIQTGMDGSPTTGWGALGRLAQTLAGTYVANSGMNDLRNTISSGRRSASEDLMAALQASKLPSKATAKTASTAASDSGAGDYGNAISGLESGGNYAALGPTTKTGDRAYGKYQVMGANIPEWTQAALGKALTPEQFLASPEAQDAVFKAKFGEYAQKYGPEGAAKAWFAGEKGMNNPNARDQLGTTVQSYADRFTTALNGQPGVAAIDQAASGQPQSAAVPSVQPVAPAAAPTKVAQAAPEAPEPSIDVHRLMAVLQNPYADDATKQIAQKLILQQLAPPDYNFQTLPDGTVVRTNPRDGTVERVYQGGIKEDFGFQTLPDGTVIRTNKHTGAVEPAYQGPRKAEWGVVGKDQYGQPVYGYPPSPEEYSTQKKQAPPEQSANPLGSSLQGKDLLAALQKQNPAVASQVTAIIEGRAPYPTGSRLNPVQQQVKELVTQIDPTFEVGNSGARIKVRNEFNSGGPSSPAAAITAGNTAIQHLGHLSDEAEKLGNLDTGIPGNNLANRVKNMVAVSAGGGIAASNFDSIRNKYIEEATKFYRGTGGNEADLQRDIEALNSAQSPSQLRDVIRTQAELMRSKVNALQERWRHGMGPLVEDFPIIQPESQAALDRISKRQMGQTESEGGASSEKPAASEAKPSSNPDRAAIQAEMKRRGLIK